MSDGASHNPFSGIADVPLSPRAAKRHVLIRSTVFVEREEQRREHQSLINARREQRSPTGITRDTLSGDTVMHLSNQSLLVIIIVGIVAGYLAGRVMEGGGFGLIGDLLVGLIGAFIGDWLMPQLGIHLGVGIVALIINAFIGAVVLLLLLRLLGGGRGYYGRRWGRRRML
jgi:uncharacterized membrane protein YeaQ/YmgE (transglycosylase-associated protein family)